MRKILAVLSFCVLATAVGSGQGRHLLLQHPTISKTHIVFAYGGDIWIAPRQGGQATRLVAGPGLEGDPLFSPDGSMVAYTGNYDGNLDVFVVPAAGGEPRRLTYHPGPDVAVGWTPDSRRVLFRSPRTSYSDPDRLFTVAVTGGFPEQLPLDMAESGAYSPDESHLAYVPISQWEPDWKHYRGGQTTPIWVANLADSSTVEIPRENSNDKDPMWIGDTVYFLSDRNGAVTLFAYDTKTKAVTEVVHNTGMDLSSASAGPGAIAYAQFGRLFVYDLASRRATPVDVTVAADMPQVRPHFEKVEDQIENASISPTGKRAVFEAHGDILTVPAEKGDIRDITHSPAVADRDPAWSPDGRRVAYFSDESGEYALHLSDQSGLGAARAIDLGQPPSFFYAPTWSPDSKQIAYSDKRLNLWYVDVDHPTPVKVDTDRFDSPMHEFDAVWSPDSRWIAYTKQLPNHLRAVFVYSLATHAATQVTDGMSDCLYPSFDESGKYLYFTASTNMGLTTGWLDMTSDAHPVTRSAYVVVLRQGPPVAARARERRGEGGGAEGGGRCRREGGGGREGGIRHGGDRAGGPREGGDARGDD